MEYLEFTKKNYLKFSSKQLLHKKTLNPLIWQYGHVIYFYINHVLKNLEIDYKYRDDETKKLVEFYDSFKTPCNMRIQPFMLTYYKCMELYDCIIKQLEDFIKNSKIGKKESYLIMLGILHNEMHNEAFIFICFNLSINISYHRIIFPNTEAKILIENPAFVKYESGSFKQGSREDKNRFVFDNEMPRFKKKIDEFSISKYPITEHMFAKFVLEGGYTNDKIWSRVGLFWRNNNGIELPLYWKKINNRFFKKINGQIYETNTNLPMSNISYYEAEAFCNFYNYRLPTESEFEFVSTNRGKTKYPWGNSSPDSNLCNINYKRNIIEVNHVEFKNGINFDGISQLIGNIWEWCEEPIYPYDGFKIDPVYREMSYPFFGYKKICKGGCFAVPDFLISPQYRNAQYPYCREQIIGFRVCQKI